jgi:hypothetical protein
VLPALARAGQPPTSIFTGCPLLTTYYAPYHLQNDWTGLQIGVCTDPVASWPTLWAPEALRLTAAESPSTVRQAPPAAPDMPGRAEDSHLRRPIR